MAWKCRKRPKISKKYWKRSKRQDPNGNGKADEVPLSGSTEDFGVRVIPFLMNGFVYDDDRNYLNLTNGKVDPAANKPEWKEGLTYIKSLYDEGLIDPGAFTQNAEAFKKIGENADAKFLAQARACIRPSSSTSIKATKIQQIIIRYRRFRAAWFTLPRMMAGGVAPGAKFVITNKASKEAQIALIKMVDYMFTPEGQTNARIGYGRHRLEKAGSRRSSPRQRRDAAIQTDSAVEGEAPHNAGWSGMAHFYMPKEYRDSFVQGTDIYDSDGLRTPTVRCDAAVPRPRAEGIVPGLGDLDRSGANGRSEHAANEHQELYRAELAAIRYGNKDLDKDWDAYVKGLKDLKLDRYLEILQKAYDSSNQK